MKLKPKILILDGMPTSGKSTISYMLATKLPGWIFVDIWRIKEMFESLGYSEGNLEEKEKEKLMKISKKTILDLSREIIKKTQRNIILQDINTQDIKDILGKELKKQNYQIFTVQLKVPFKEAIKRNRKRKKPDLNLFKTWTEEKWNNKIKKKIKKGDIIIDTSKNNKKKTVEIILKFIGEKAKKHPYKKFIKEHW